MEQFDDLIFKYFKPDENSSFSSLKGLDLKELICLINQVYIRYRNYIGVDEKYTFGIEIEMEDVLSLDCVNKNILDLNLSDKWIVKKDSTLDNGAEINSPPLRDSYYCWNDLNKVCEKSKYLGIIKGNCGGHIHFGTHNLGNEVETWINFLKLWSVYENIIFRFGYGEFFGPRPIIEDYASKISSDLWYVLFESGFDFKNVYEVLSLTDLNKSQAINFYNAKKKGFHLDTYQFGNTIEVRCFNGSLNHIIWQNYINLVLKMMMYAKRFDFDHDIINRRHEKIYHKYDSIEHYNQIYLDQALEFCDLIFDNNLDKIYFLRQYLKTTEIFPKEKPFTRTREFTK